MNWIKSRVKVLNGQYMKPDDPDSEKKRASERIRRFHFVCNQFVYAISYFSDELIYLSDGVEKLLSFKPEEIRTVSFFTI